MLALPDEYGTLGSAYLTGGYHEDAASLDDLAVTRSAVRGRFRMIRQFEEADGRFELSVPNVIIWTLQLAEIYGCHQHDCRAPARFALREIALKCLHPVTDPGEIVIRLRIRFRRAVPGGIHYVGDLDVADGGFTGRIGFVLPTG
jgi:hypothetical protein